LNAIFGGRIGGAVVRPAQLIFLKFSRLPLVFGATIATVGEQFEREPEGRS
jgi:hypothetical protein